MLLDLPFFAVCCFVLTTSNGVVTTAARLAAVPVIKLIPLHFNSSTRQPLNSVTVGCTWCVSNSSLPAAPMLIRRISVGVHARGSAGTSATTGSSLMLPARGCQEDDHEPSSF